MMAPQQAQFSADEDVLKPMASALVEVLAAVKRGENQRRALDGLVEFASLVEKAYESLPPEEKFTPHTRVHNLLSSLLLAIDVANEEATAVPDTTLHIRFEFSKKEPLFEVVP